METLPSPGGGDQNEFVGWEAEAERRALKYEGADDFAVRIVPRLSSAGRK